MSYPARYPDLAGKVALVTGAGRPKGLGEAIARRLAAEGAHIAVHDIGQTKGEAAPAHGVGTRSDLQQVVDGIRAEGGSAIAVTADLLIEDDIAAMVERTVAEWGRLDILVNNAGVGYLFGELVELTQAQWDTVLGVNLRGTFLAMKYAIRQFLAQEDAGQGRGGAIVNIGSRASKSGSKWTGAYTSSKHALVGLTRTAALEYGSHGIRVNGVAPNHVTTGLGAWQNDFMSKARGMELEEYRAWLVARNPLGRVGLPSDTAEATAFLCSDAAAYITGEFTNVSGGEAYW